MKDEISKTATVAEIIIRDERQKGIFQWCCDAFGFEHAHSIEQRGLRLLEETLEACQAAGVKPEMAHKLIVLPGSGSVMFVNGCFWHGHTCSRGALPTSNVEFWQQKINRNRKRDRRAQRELRKEGWKVLTVWQCETKHPEKLERRLIQFLTNAAFTNDRTKAAASA